MEERGPIVENDKSIEQSKHGSPVMEDKDESGFGEDISACSIEDKNFSEKMDIHDQENHHSVEQSGNNKVADESLTDQSFSFSGMKKDDSGIYSDKSTSSANMKETSDGEWSESVGESLEEANVEMKEHTCSQKHEVQVKDISENTDPEVTKLKSNDAIKSDEDNNVKRDGIELMEQGPVENNSKSDKDIDERDNINDKELKDCDTEESTQVSNEIEQTETDRQQKYPDICDNIEETNDDDDDFADFVRKSVKSHSQVRKLVDYDSDDSDNENSDSSPVFTKGHRRYRKRKPEADSDDDTSANERKEKATNEENDGTPVLLRHSQLNEHNEQNNVDISDLSSDSSDESTHSPKTRHESSSDNEPDDVPPELSEFGPPKHKWRALFDLRKREFGLSNAADNGYFRRQVQGSLQMVKRFDLQFKMDQHEGCVNALHFNRIGTLLASGSDDLNIVIWNWLQNRPALVYDSGHRSNVFQAKFMPFSGDCHVVSCARDGQVRLADLSSTGVCKGTKKIAQHRGAAHKLALETDSPHLVLSAGEDAVTFEIDVRQDKPNKLVTTKENDKKVSIYSIHSNPANSNEFCLGGRDHFIRLYDKRKINEEVNSGLLKKFAPHHIVEGGNDNIKANVTCACYSYNGAEVLGTYNDEDIYLFSNEHSDSANYIHRYKGHRNNQTVKGVNFYGPESEFIVSGSDCGNIFLWDKDTENIVQYMKGDEGGVINVLEPHPYAPILATSGLDHDVKIWAPTAENPTNLKGLKKLMKRNTREREEERSSEGGMIDGSMLWFIMHHLRRGRRQRAREARAARGEPAPEEETSDTLSDEDLTTDEDSDDDEGENPRDAISCNPS